MSPQASACALVLIVVGLMVYGVVDDVTAAPRAEKEERCKD